MAVEPSYDREDGPGGADFEDLVTRYYGSLYRFAMSLSGTETDAADLVQDTFLTWAAKGDQLKDRSKAKSWLFTTLHRRFLESRRRSTRFPHTPIEETEADLPNIEPEVVNALDAGMVVEMLGRIDEQYQAPVALFYLEDYAYQEIAEILDIPIGTVKSRIARGLIQLKQQVLRQPNRRPPQKEPQP